MNKKLYGIIFIAVILIPLALLSFLDKLLALVMLSNSLSWRLLFMMSLGAVISLVALIGGIELAQKKKWGWYMVAFYFIFVIIIGIYLVLTQSSYFLNPSSSIVLTVLFFLFSIWSIIYLFTNNVLKQFGLLETSRGKTLGLLLLLNILTTGALYIVVHYPVWQLDSAISDFEEENQRVREEMMEKISKNTITSL